MATDRAVKREGPKFPIQSEPRIPTLDRPVIVESAFPGWLPVSVNPHIPIKTDEVVRETIESIRAGASAIHVHPRDPVDGLTRFDFPMLKATLDPVFAACGDVFTWNHTWTWSGERFAPIDYISHTKHMLEDAGDTRYCQASVVLLRGNPGDAGDADRLMPMSGDERAIKEGVPFLEEHGIKPIFQIYDTHGLEFLARELIEPGLAKWEPFVCCLHMGKHHAMYCAKDPWAHMQLIAMMNAARDAVPGCLVGLRAGGRNWLPLTVAALTLGIDMVGVGMEDCLWMYPHRDEIMEKNSDVIGMIVGVVRALGREVATPQVVRRILGITKAPAGMVA